MDTSNIHSDYEILASVLTVLFQRCYWIGVTRSLNILMLKKRQAVMLKIYNFVIF